LESNPNPIRRLGEESTGAEKAGAQRRKASPATNVAATESLLMRRFLGVKRNIFILRLSGRVFYFDERLGGKA